MAQNSAWELYDKLINDIPEDILIKDYCLGINWSYVEAECGMGVAHTVRGGTRVRDIGDARNKPLRYLAEYTKSWNYDQATLGTAALNAWYAQPDKVDEINAQYDKDLRTDGSQAEKMNAFDIYYEEMHGKNIVVVGHFPKIERLNEIGNLTILERNCKSELDVPDPACEYILPETDFAFITGTSITNKTCSRLLQLSSNAKVILLGPSVVPSAYFFDYGVNALAASVVADPEYTKFLVKKGPERIFGKALHMIMAQKPE